MIDSSAILLTIVMTTPAEFHDDSNNTDYVSFHSMSELMQRLCWPHTHTLDLNCEAKNHGVSIKREQAESKITKSLNSLKLINGRPHQ